MPLKRLNASDGTFQQQFEALLEERAENTGSVAPVVAEIIADVRTRGDKAVCELTQKFDNLSLTAKTMRVSNAEIAEAEAACSEEVKEALSMAAGRLRRFHEKQTPDDIDYTDSVGNRLGMTWNAITDVGIYVPGGKASYPSSVLHNAIPAKVAGCQRVVMVAPAQDGVINPSVLVAAKLAGVDEIYKIGGAQAVAALAYGTDTIKPVYKIVGPGNAFVAEAKRQVFGKVGIDTIAGPSEILVVADNQNNPQWIAADLLSQAEHDEGAQSIFITDDATFADAVDAAIDEMLEGLSRKDIAAASIQNYGLSLVVSNMDDAIALINNIAPEHLELAVEHPRDLSKKLHNAGAIFLGRYTPEAVGDYVAGPSHVLPTTQAARYSSGLSVYDFIKKTSLIECNKAGFLHLAPATATLADNEGLTAHALSARIRMDD